MKQTTNAAPQTMPMLLEVVHDTHYAYTGAVTLAHHLAHLQPLADAHQQLQSFMLSIEPGPDQSRDSADAFGNIQNHFSLTRPHERLAVRATSRVAVWPRFDALQAVASPAWDTLVESLRYVAGAPLSPALEYAVPSPYVPRLPALRDYAAASLRPGRPVAEVAIELMHRMHADFAYESETTEVDTPLAQAFAQRRGVCQDFAHLLAGALRMCGLPARYVSGYLLTRAADSGHAMLGADASHAWVQAWCPGTPGVPVDAAGEGWLDLDPTNDVLPSTSHIRVAIGRDFGDVTPLRGVIRGGGEHTLQVGVTTRVLRSNP